MDSSDSYINKGSNNKHMVNASSIIPEMKRKFPISIPPPPRPLVLKFLIITANCREPL